VDWLLAMALSPLRRFYRHRRIEEEEEEVEA
jgi:hypothetical protein